MKIRQITKNKIETIVLIIDKLPEQSKTWVIALTHIFYWGFGLLALYEAEKDWATFVSQWNISIRWNEVFEVY